MEWQKQIQKGVKFVNLFLGVTNQFLYPDPENDFGKLTQRKRRMKHYLFACVIICLFNIIQIQSKEWVKITPTFNPEGNYNMSLGIFIDKNNGWFTEEFPGRTWRTQDGGLTWNMQLDSSDIWSYNIEFFDCNYGWIIGKKACHNMAVKISIPMKRIL